LREKIVDKCREGAEYRNKTINQVRTNETVLSFQFKNADSVCEMQCRLSNQKSLFFLLAHPKQGDPFFGGAEQEKGVVLQKGALAISSETSDYRKYLNDTIMQFQIDLFDLGDSK
jgi:hypothetical protein